MRFFLPAIFLTFSLHSYSQNIDSTINIYGDKYGQERIYIQYDKATYSPGESIWFKAYLMQGLYPAEESKTLYIDFTDGDGRLLLRNVGPIVSATSNGQFDIPVDFKGSFIHVRAYTKWMLNFDSAFLYNKDILILGKTANLTAKDPVISTIQFFPEGGDAIAGLKNKIAFKANDQWGKPVKVKGIIVNNEGKTIDSLRVRHDGMGYFYIMPKPGESYIAKWKDENGADNNTALPLIISSGISLQVTISDGKREFDINATPDAAAKFGKLHLIGTMFQHEVFKVTKDISSGNTKGVIPTQNLPSGILTITVFDEQWNPLAERITYINNEEYLFHPEMTVQHWGLSKRALNIIEVGVPDSLEANLAVSVTDVDIDTDSSDNIISHLLLSGDIRGQVYNPSYYFSNTSDSIAQQLDLVMLTHGWRRFNWQEIVKGKLPAIHYPKDTSYLTLSGRIYGVLPSNFRSGATIILLVSKQKGDGKILVLPILPDGTFNDPDYIFLDTLHVYYQLPKKQFGDATAGFMENLLSPLSNNIRASGFSNNSINDTTGNSRHYQLADEMNRILQQYEGKLLEEVTIKTKTKSPLEILDQKYASGLFTSSDAYQFDLVNDNMASASLNIFYYLQGKVAGLQINPNSSPPSLQWRGGSPAIFIDEIQTDADMISSVPVTDVAYIKVFRPPFMGGFNGSNGAIAIYTRRGSDVKNAPGKGLANNLVRGYSPIRQFYSPNYGSFKRENERKDTRTTLYWNPQVTTGPGKSKVTLSFYNNDVSRAFRVVIEGITKDGQLTHWEQIME